VTSLTVGLQYRQDIPIERGSLRDSVKSDQPN